MVICLSIEKFIICLENFFTKYNKGNELNSRKIIVSLIESTPLMLFSLENVGYQYLAKKPKFIKDEEVYLFNCSNRLDSYFNKSTN